VRDATEALISLYRDHSDLTPGHDVALQTLLLADGGRDPAGASSGSSSDAASWAEACRRLDGPLAAYFVGEEHSFLWIVANGQTEMHVLPGRQDLLAQIKPVAADMRTPGQLVGKEAVATLSRLLLGPLARQWRLGETLHLLPDDVLCSVPWRALLVSAGEGELSDQVLEHGPLVEILSVASLAASLGDTQELQPEHGTGYWPWEWTRHLGRRGVPLHPRTFVTQSRKREKSRLCGQPVRQI